MNLKVNLNLNVHIHIHIRIHTHIQIQILTQTHATMGAHTHAHTHAHTYTSGTCIHTWHISIGYRKYIFMYTSLAVDHIQALATDLYRYNIHHVEIYLRAG